MKKVKMIVLGMVVLSLMSALLLFQYSLPVMFQIQLSTLVREVTMSTPCRSIWREKKDYTSVWCENKSTSGGSLSVWVQRTNK